MQGCAAVSGLSTRPIPIRFDVTEVWRRNRTPRGLISQSQTNADHHCYWWIDVGHKTHCFLDDALCCKKPFTLKCVGLFLLTRLRPERWLLFLKRLRGIGQLLTLTHSVVMYFLRSLLLFSGVLWTDNVNVQIFSNDVRWTDRKHCGYWHSHRSYFPTELSVCSVTAKDWKLKLIRQHLPSLKLEPSWLFSVHSSVCCWEFHCRSILVLSGLGVDHGHGVHTAIAPLTDVIYSRSCIAENWLCLTNCSRQVHSQQQYIH